MSIRSGLLEVPIFVIPVSIYFFFYPAYMTPGVLLGLALAWFIVGWYLQAMKDAFDYDEKNRHTKRRLK